MKKLDIILLIVLSIAFGGVITLYLYCKRINTTNKRTKIVATRDLNSKVIKDLEVHSLYKKGDTITYHYGTYLNNTLNKHTAVIIE